MSSRFAKFKAIRAKVKSSRGGEVTNTGVLTEALITNYNDMKSEFDQLD